LTLALQLVDVRQQDLLSLVRHTVQHQVALVILHHTTTAQLAAVLTVKVRVRICGRRTRALSRASRVTLKVRCMDGDFENMTSPTNQK